MHDTAPTIRHRFVWKGDEPEPRVPLIVLAEDDLEMRRFLGRELRRGGFEVEELSDGAELLRRLGDGREAPNGLRRPDVVVSDVRMPNEGGLSVLDRLRQTDWEMPFILITAFGNQHVHEQAVRLGALCFDKPFDPDDLLTAIVNIAPIR